MSKKLTKNVTYTSPMTPKALSRNEVSKNQCIYTVETGKHEWNTYTGQVVSVA